MAKYAGNLTSSEYLHLDSDRRLALAGPAFAPGDPKILE